MTQIHQGRAGTSLTSASSYSMKDPRMNAPVCISHLPPDQRRQAMIDRFKQDHARFMATYQQPKKDGLFAKLRRAVAL